MGSKSTRMCKQWVFLIGFSGSGKSSVGRELAKRLKGRFDDLDSLVERQAGGTVAEIFERSSEEAFRRFEVDGLKKLLMRRQAGVVALGGGAFESVEIRVLTGAHGVTVFLTCSVRELYRRLQGSNDRPLLRVTPRQGETLCQAKQRRIRSLLSKRLANYRRADLILSTSSRTVAQAAREIERKMVTRR